MKKALKELIQKAEVRTSGEFDSIMIVPKGKYDGFWGKNCYDNMLVLGSIYDEGV